MSIMCSICREPFLEHCDICITECGHVYHHSCLDIWYKRSPTCPQCRGIRFSPLRLKLHFETTTERDMGRNAKTLADREKVEHDLALTTKEVQKSKEQYESLKQEASLLEQALRKYNMKANRLKFEIGELENEIRIIQTRLSRRGKLEEYNKLLKERLDLLNNFNKCIDGSDADLHNVLDKIPIEASSIKFLWAVANTMKLKLLCSKEKFEMEKNSILQKIESAQKDLINQKNEKGKRPVCRPRTVMEIIRKTKKKLKNKSLWMHPKNVDIWKKTEVEETQTKSSSNRDWIAEMEAECLATIDTIMKPQKKSV